MVTDTLVLKKQIFHTANEMAQHAPTRVQFFFFFFRGLLEFFWILEFR